MMGLEEMLFSTISQSNIGETVRLLSLGANVNIKNKHGNTPIHLAILCRDTLMVQTLVKLGADTDIKNGIGLTALSIATLSNNLEVVNDLLRLGAKSDLNNYDGTLPIHLAVQRGYLDIVRTLLREATVNSYNDKEYAPLHLAVILNRIEIIEVLIKYSYTDINIQDNQNGNTALIIATQKDNLTIVKLLLRNRADFAKKNREGKTFNEFASTRRMQCITLRYEKLLEWLNTGLSQSIPSKPLFSSTSDISLSKTSVSTQSSTRSTPLSISDTNSSKISISELSISQCKKDMNQPDTSTSWFIPTKSPILEHMALSDVSSINLYQLTQSEFSEHEYPSDKFAPKSNLSGSLIRKCSDMLESNSSESILSEFSQGNKRIKLR